MHDKALIWTLLGMYLICRGFFYNFIIIVLLMLVLLLLTDFFGITNCVVFFKPFFVESKIILGYAFEWFHKMQISGKKRAISFAFSIQANLIECNAQKTATNTLWWPFFCYYCIDYAMQISKNSFWTPKSCSEARI